MGITPDLVDFEQALRMVREAAAARGAVAGTERVSLQEARGRVLAEALVADRDQPAFDRSTRDGFAVRAAELSATEPLPVVGEVRAGDRWQDRDGSPQLPARAAVAIMTGAPIPPGADAVVMVEHATRTPAGIVYGRERTLTAGENIVPRGREARAGSPVLAPGTRLGPAEIALAASCGVAMPLVYRRPLVAIVATGDELVDVGDSPGPQQIRNSNSYALAALVAEAGGEAFRLPIAPDTREAIAERVAQGRMFDLLLFSGGVSMGEYDLVEEVLGSFGAEFLCTGVRMQPGKPVVFGRLPERNHNPSGNPPATTEPECLFFGLPGNPISTEVTFRCFAEPVLRTLAGEREAAPRWALAQFVEPAEAVAGLTRLRPAHADSSAPGQVEVRITPWQGSGDLLANARANCYAELLPGRAYRAGEPVRILLR